MMETVLMETDAHLPVNSSIAGMVSLEGPSSAMMATLYLETDVPLTAHLSTVEMV